MKIRERIKASPYVIAGLADAYSNIHDGKTCSFWAPNGTPQPETNPIYGFFQVSYVRQYDEELRPPVVDRVFVTIVTTLPGCSRLTLEASDEDWQHFRPWWEQFRNELIADGLIDGQSLIVEPTIPPPPDKNASAEAHALWQDQYGAAAGSGSIKDYANNIMGKEPKTLYNTRTTLGLGKSKKSGNKGKSKGN